MNRVRNNIGYYLYQRSVACVDMYIQKNKPCSLPVRYLSILAHLEIDAEIVNELINLKSNCTSSCYINMLINCTSDLHYVTDQELLLEMNTCQTKLIQFILLTYVVTYTVRGGGQEENTSQIIQVKDYYIKKEHIHVQIVLYQTTENGWTESNLGQKRIW